jgi:hypothetical protein
VISLDPGIRGCGVAQFEGSRLARAAYAPNPIRKGNDLAAVVEMAAAVFHWAGQPDSLVAEWPQSYGPAHQKGDQADLFPLAGIDAALAAMMAWGRPLPVSRYLPHEWKGTINADAMLLRIRKRLTVSENNAIDFPVGTCPDCRTGDRPCRKSNCLAHNVVDAIGLGLFHLGRLAPKKVIAR